MPIKCEIVSQSKVVFQGDVDIVIIPGAEGQMGICHTTRRY
jgi:F0F1-type ATP synthase epsilon subunit